MMQIEKIINDLCPNGVEYKTIEEIADNVFAGGTPTSSNPDYYGGEIPWLRSGEINFNRITSAEIAITQEGYDNSSAKWVKAKSVLIAMTGATVARSAVNEIELTANQSVCAIEPKQDVIDYMFLYYCISNMYKDIKAKAQGALTSINLKIIKSLLVPLPPLAAQREIVHVLDKFTLLSAELAAELAARRVQYDYYRDSLLNFDVEVKRVKLKDIATEFYRGSGITRDQVTDVGIPCVRYGEIYTKYNTWFDTCFSHTNINDIQSPKYFEYGDILFAITGESVEEIAKSTAYVGKEKCLAGGDIVVMKHNQNPKYLAYALSTYDAQQQKSKGKIKSKVVHSNVPSIENIEIFLPSLAVQERIVDVLDNFDKICTDLKIGLPAEIEKRQQQYEYYRDKLLTFKEKVN